QGGSMKLTIQREQLIHSMNHVMKAVSSKTTIPILTGVKLTATEEVVSLTGSNANISIEDTIPLTVDDKAVVTVENPGSIVIQGNFFSELVKRLPDEKVEIEVDEHFSMRICSGQSEFNLNGLDPQEYPR